MPANDCTPPYGENVSESRVENQLRREWVEIRLAFVSDAILNPRQVQNTDEIGLRERVEKAQEELEVLGTVLDLDEDKEWQTRR